MIIDEDWKVLKVISLNEGVATGDIGKLAAGISVVDKSVGSTELLESVDKSTATVVVKSVGLADIADEVAKVELSPYIGGVVRREDLTARNAGALRQ